MKAVKEKLRTFCKDCCKNPGECGMNPIDCQKDPDARSYFEQYETTYGSRTGTKRGRLITDEYTTAG